MIIDASMWQGHIDWPTVKAKNPQIEGVYIKASEGIGYIDPKMTYNAVEANKVGLKTGFYHFASLNAVDVVNDARTEAKYFLKVTRTFTKSLPYVLDLEDEKCTLSPDKVLLWTKSFFKELNDAGIMDGMLYSNTPFLNLRLPKNHGLGEIPLWIAAYTIEYKLPHGWDKVILWQYTQHGMVEGIKANVDISKYI